MKLSVVIPVYNERSTLGEALARVRRFVGPATPGGPPADTWEMVGVDDGSTDGTGEYLRSLPAAQHAVVVRHERNRGKGAAVRTGLQHIRGDIILVQDADLEYDPADPLRPAGEAGAEKYQNSCENRETFAAQVRRKKGGEAYGLRE